MGGLFGRSSLFTGLGVFVVLTISGIIGSIFFPYSINAWLKYFGKPEVVTWWQGLFLGYIPYFGYLSIPLAFITFILMLFLI